MRDNRTYAEAIAIEPADGHWLAIEAADEARPHLQLSAALTVTGEHPDASLTLSGLLIEGRIDVQGSLGRLRLIHSTLVPGASIAQTDPPSTLPAPLPTGITVAAGTVTAPMNQQLRVEIAFSIVGPLRIPAHCKGIWALDSVIDGANGDAIAGSTAASAGPPLWLERVTLFGRTRAKELTLASEVIFEREVIAERRQAGCVRFSFVAPGSTTPKRYRCQPDLRIAAEIEVAEAAAEAAGETFGDPQRMAIGRRVEQWLWPEFTSQQYGTPEYAQLHLACPQEIAAGAQDGAEMGAFCHLKQPQRAANLKRRLEEYLPFGLEPGLIYVT